VTGWALFSGALGALLVFFLGILRERWRNSLEEEGLLRLLLAELDHNEEVSRAIGESTTNLRDILGSPNLPAMRLATWHSARGRATQLLPRKLGEVLLNYYSVLQTLLTLRGFKKRQNDYMNRLLRQQRNPYEDYPKRMLTAQKEAREQIKEYLERPRVRRFFRFR